MSAIIAAEAMRRLPRGVSYGSYPRNTRFGDFHVSYDENLGELVAPDVFLYAGTTRSVPPAPAALRRIAGYGSSPVVSYRGLGIYFLDRVRPGVWRLEVYPDAVPVRDPFEAPNPGKVVTRAIRRDWEMSVSLPDLGNSFSVQPIGDGRATSVVGNRFSVTPGVYVLSSNGPVDRSSLPATMGEIGFGEFHAPPADTLPLSVQSLAAPEYVTGRDIAITARIVDVTAPDSARVYIKPTAGGFYRGFAMKSTGGYSYAATIPAGQLAEGLYQFVVTVFRGDTAQTFPDGVAAKPTDWDYSDERRWMLDVVSPQSPLRLFEPERDADRLAFTRIGDAGRTGLFRLGVSPATGRAVFHLELPVFQGGGSPTDYTASLAIKARIKARAETISVADAVHIRLRGLGAHQVLTVTLMEDDGTSWSAPVTVDSTWSEVSIPLASFTPARGVLLPEGFPGEWNYWVGPAAGRGAPGDHPKLDHIERLQLSLRREEGVAVTPGSYGVEVEWVALSY
jgi:hypothetical protein